MKHNVLLSRDFYMRKETFFKKRKIIVTNKDEREKLLSLWINNVRSSPLIDRLSEFQELIKRKTSKDGLLQVGFEIGETAGFANPLLYAPSLRRIEDRRDYLQNVLNLLSNPSKEENN